MRRGEPLAPEALEPIRQGMHRQFGPFSAGIATGVQMRHDHGVSIGTMISSRNSAFWESCRAQHPCAPRKAMVSRSGSFEHSRSSSCGGERFQTVEDLRLALHDWLSL
jgi:hypothetical protein